jgi:hypothetical protein
MGEQEIMPQRMSTDALVQITRGEVDMQVSTAKAYPRSITKFQQDAMTLATQDKQIAAECFYVVPRGGKTVEGPGARLAEIIAGSWGNIRAETRILGHDGNEVTAQAMCWDMEKNVAIRTEVKRRIKDKHGKTFSDDIIVLTGNAAASIALRNAIFKVIPMALVKPIYEKCREVAAGDAKSLAQSRTEMVNYFKRYGITEARILFALGKGGVADIGTDDIATLRGIATAIKEGSASIDDCFPADEGGTSVRTPDGFGFGKKTKEEPKGEEGESEVTQKRARPGRTPPKGSGPEPAELEQEKIKTAEMHEAVGIPTPDMRGWTMDQVIAARESL